MNTSFAKKLLAAVIVSAALVSLVLKQTVQTFPGVGH
jgi:sporulation-control protein spo0M